MNIQDIDDQIEADREQRVEREQAMNQRREHATGIERRRQRSDRQAAMEAWQTPNELGELSGPIAWAEIGESDEEEEEEEEVQILDKRAHQQQGWEARTKAQRRLQMEEARSEDNRLATVQGPQ